MKRLWLVRLGKNAEFESDALDKSLLSIGFNVTADLSGAKDRDAVLDRLRGAASRRIEACSCCRHGREGPRLRGFPDLPSKSQVTGGTIGEEVDQTVNLELIARDQIERRISSVFTGHDFTNLIAAILTAQGYETHVSPPGPDSGIDIVAGRGALGFEPPCLVVQVKSGDINVDDPTLQRLIGCVPHGGQGLLVSWSDFKPTVRKRTNELYFRVRFWGRDEIVNALLSVYDRLPEEIRAELPLRRTWTLVPEDEEGSP